MRLAKFFYLGSLVLELAVTTVGTVPVTMLQLRGALIR
jgi:hypothetical protein